MPHIVVACPNPSLDRTIEVDSIQAGHVHRAERADVRAGGKGINVARALAAIGTPSRVAVITAGRTGAAVAGLMDDEGIDHVDTSAPGETRSCLVVLSPSAPTVFNESGPKISRRDWDRYEQSVAALLAGAAVFVCSGSFPLGVPDDAAARLVSAASGRGVATVCDTSRAQLRHALERGPDVVAPNLAEALDILRGGGTEPVDPGEGALEAATEAAAALARRGPGSVVVTAGSAGAALARRGEVVAFPAATVSVRNPVGAGDCLVAGIAAEIAASADIDAAVRRGMAMAAAGCETFGAGSLDPARADELLVATWPA